jgi:hypothetical protein
MLLNKEASLIIKKYHRIIIIIYCAKGFLATGKKEKS